MQAPADKQPDIRKIIKVLRKEVRHFEVPIVTEVSRLRRGPFEVLVTTILSARTKDYVTRVAARRLLEKASTPEAIISMKEQDLARLIFPVGFYKTKAKNLKKMSADLLENFGGEVPDDLDELLKLAGVGRKTANLVITLGFGKPGICVDTHVHRLSNRLGYVVTKDPEATEMALRAKLPKQYWIEYNDLLVTWGQNICRPISPFCSKCAIRPYCMQVGVTIQR
jgi:endonuclease III